MIASGAPTGAWSPSSVRQAVDAAGARRDHVEFVQRHLLRAGLRLGRARRGLALRDLLAARAVFEFQQRRLRGAHLRLGAVGRGAGAIDFGRGDQLAPAQRLHAR